MGEDATNDATADNGRSSVYVHDPSTFSEGGEDAGDGSGGRARTTRAYHPEVASPGEFGAKGWLLVATLFVAFVCVPAAILFIPYSNGFIESLGLTWRDAYLTLPLVPALLLATLAVYVALSD